MGYMVRRDPTGPNKTVFRVDVTDSTAATNNEPEPPPGPLPGGELLDVLWGNGPPPNMDSPENQQYDSYVDLDSGEVWVRG